MTPEEIEALQKTNDDLVARISQLESINIDLVDQKKELKQKLTDGFNNDDMQKELKNYKDQLAKVEADKQELEAGYTSKLSALQMKNVLRDLNVEGQTPEALDTITKLVLDGATNNDGNFAYLNEDGTTKFNESNAEYSVIDRVNELRESGNAYHFKQATGADGGKTTPTAPKNHKPDINDIINRGLKY